MCNAKKKACGRGSRVPDGCKQRNLFGPRVTLRTKLVGDIHMSSVVLEPFRTTCNARLVGEVLISSGWCDATAPCEPPCNAKDKAYG